MKDETQNELLSAYIDGELTPDERAQVEQLLKTNPAARQLVDELRALSGTLKSLPRQKLGVDLSESVIKIAEQRKLEEKKGISEKKGTGTLQEPEKKAEKKGTEEKTGTGTLQEPVPVFSAILRRMKNPRVWVWEAVIVAVVVLLLVFNPNQNAPPAGHAERQIAMATRSEPARQRGVEQAPSIQAAPSSVSAAGDEGGAVRKLSQGAIDSSGRAGGMEVEQRIAKGESTAVSGSSALGQEKIEENKGMAISSDKQSGGIAITRDGNLSLGDKLTIKEAPKNEPMSTAKPAAPPAEQPAEKEIVDQIKTDAFSADELLVVHCEISPEALKNHAFDKLLADNSIVWSDMPKDKQLDENAPKPEKVQSRSDINGDRSAVELESQTQSEDFRKKNESQKAGKLEIVYVEASRAQIEGTLNGLSARSDAFQTVSVSPANKDVQLKDSAELLNRRREMPEQGREWKLKAEQSKDAVKYHQTTPGITPNAGNNVVLGRAQRIPQSFEYDDAAKDSLREMDGKQNVADIAQKALSKSMGYKAMPAQQAAGSGGRLGVGGGAYGYGAAGAPAQTAQPEGAVSRLKAANAGQQSAAATASSSPVSAVPTRAGMNKESANKAQKSQGDYLGNFQITQSGSIASQQTQRVLFVLEVVDQKSFSNRAKAAAAAEAMPADAAPVEAKPPK